MSLSNRYGGWLRQTLFPLVLSTATAVYPQAQKAGPGQKPQPGDHTIRINVGLVQTDVMVFDRQGHFVPDLKLDQFELRVDGKAQPISFLEMISAGSAHDQEIWATQEGKDAPMFPPPSADSNPGRMLLFFVDDWHLSADSIMRSRTALSNLLNASMSSKDRVAIFAASGQLGSAQQLSGDKAVLLAVLEKLNFQSAGPEDLAWPPLTENQALMLDQNDRDMLTYFVSAILGKPVNLDANFYQGREVQDAVEVTKKRAAALVQTSAGIGERSLSALRDLLRSAALIPGRKLVFLLSDGFVLQTHRSDIVSRIGEVTTAAARAGIVVYTLDARGLVVGLPDAKVKRGPDMTGALAHSGSNEAAAPMDALNALAADTGGRFLRNTNALDTALITTLAEVSRYYLLAWPIDLDRLQPGRYSTIRVGVKGRSGLRVQVRQGSLDLSQLVSKKPVSGR